MKQLTFRTIIQKDGKGWIEANLEQGWEIPTDEGIETIDSVQITF